MPVNCRQGPPRSPWPGPCGADKAWRRDWRDTRDRASPSSVAGRQLPPLGEALGGNGGMVRIRARPLPSAALRETAAATSPHGGGKCLVRIRRKLAKDVGCRAGETDCRASVATLARNDVFGGAWLRIRRSLARGLEGYAGQSLSLISCWATASPAGGSTWGKRGHGADSRETPSVSRLAGDGGCHLPPWGRQVPCADSPKAGKRRGVPRRGDGLPRQCCDTGSQ